ncbi:unnamed protein product [Vicia faba]|uniref:Uncharacterized protein n=1 Tax=Vicia faba TaxID=3906 RepID=A0AAV1B9Y7_VICFA|nr:unnamed protein product [Vicia faba]
MFSSLSTFHHSLNTDSFYFTDPSVELFPSSNADNSNNLNTPLPSHAPNELVPDVELNTRPPSPTPTEPVPDVDIVPASRHSTRVSNPPTHLNDSIATLLLKLFMSLVLIERQVLTPFGSKLCLKKFKL